MRLEYPALSGVAAALAVAATGCGDPKRGDVEVNWTFAGQNCVQAGVHVIQIDVANELLTPNRYFCTDPADGSVRTGAVLESFLPGTYRITITGLDRSEAILYQTTQDFTVHFGNNVVPIDVQALPSASISLDWSFGGQTCAEAGVTVVHVGIDGVVVTDAQTGSTDLPCTAGGIDGTQITELTPGTHRLALVGLRGGQPSYWLQSLTATLAAKADALVRVDLPAGTPTFATADVAWDALQSGGGFALGAQGAMTCSEAQVDTVSIRLDPNPDGTAGILLNDVPCATFDAGGNEFDGALVSPISAGTHTFAIDGIRNTAAGPVIVYATRRPVSARFEVGLVSNVDVVADPIGSARGNATLVWDFGTSSPVCPISVTLTDPSGNRQATQTVGCGDFPLPNIASGLWGIDAAAGAFQAHVLFGVPNQSSAAWQISFTR
jgi:hypothetical protein